MHLSLVKWLDRLFREIALEFIQFKNGSLKELNFFFSVLKNIYPGTFSSI